ncbi:MAG: response regulator [Elusimicrobia bacterium]|nr:response regulator [Elusimicrobiota bacterium]
MSKILAVEDNPAILDFYQEFFSDAGFDVKTADDALKAIAAQTEFKADLILLDLNIPEGGGLLVFETLRARQDMVPIIFSTGKPETIVNLAELPNVNVVKKPTAPEVLMALVQKTIASSRPAEPKMNPVPPPPPRLPPGRP